MTTPAATTSEPLSPDPSGDHLEQIDENAVANPTSPCSNEKSFDGHTDDDISVDLNKDIQEIKQWDEGGPSDCGYSQSVHDALMSIGGSVHKIAGKPSDKTKSAMGAIGNWFQEASYAVRDIFRGKTDDMTKDSSGLVNNTLNELMGAKEEEEKKDDVDTSAVSEDQPATN